AEICGVTMDWPQGRSHATEHVWELVDGLVRADTPVGLQLEQHGDPHRDAEQRIWPYLDRGLASEGLGYVQLLHRFDATTDTQPRPGIHWLSLCAKHAGQDVASL